MQRNLYDVVVSMDISSGEGIEGRFQENRFWKAKEDQVKGLTDLFSTIAANIEYLKKLAPQFDKMNKSKPQYLIDSHNKCLKSISATKKKGKMICDDQCSISGHLKDYTGKTRDFEIPDEHDVSQLSCLDRMFPGIKHRILDDQDRTREYVNIFVNGENIRDCENENTRLKAGDHILILPSVAGG